MDIYLIFKSALPDELGEYIASFSDERIARDLFKGMYTRDVRIWKNVSDMFPNRREVHRMKHRYIGIDELLSTDDRIAVEEQTLYFFIVCETVCTEQIEVDL